MFEEHQDNLAKITPGDEIDYVPRLNRSQDPKVSWIRGKVLEVGKEEPKRLKINVRGKSYWIYTCNVVQVIPQRVENAK